jgi:predicted aspartyl protease
MPWRRGDIGFELGAVVIATIVTFGAIIVTLTVGLVATAPDFATVPIIAVSLAIAVVVAVVVYPVSYTLWQAIDLIMRPPASTATTATASTTSSAAGRGGAECSSASTESGHFDAVSGDEGA